MNGHGKSDGLCAKTTSPAGPVSHFILQAARRRAAERISPWRFLVELTSRRSNVTKRKLAAQAKRFCSASRITTLYSEKSPSFVGRY
jgi:hypothetical protein